MAYLSPGVYVEEVASGAAPIGGVGTSTAGFIGLIPNTIWVQTKNPDGSLKWNSDEQDNLTPDWEVCPWTAKSWKPALTPDALEPVLVTNFTEFVDRFGSTDGTAGLSSKLEIEKSRVDENNALAHAVRGFFLNGGTRCWVVSVPTLSGEDVDWVEKALDKLALIDEIALVAIPVVPVRKGSSARVELDNGALKVVYPPTDSPTATRLTEIKSMLVDHCAVTLQDRFAIIDGVPDKPDDVDHIKGGVAETTYGAVYFPWIDVSGEGDYLPPSGHIAGLYARVDTTRGVHKAPANEVLRGARALQHRISKARQDGLNPEGVNAIREFDGTIKVWGARTLKKNDEFTYINIRRLFLYLRESIDEGTQWAVFEPNGPHLWAKIIRNVSAFLRVVWGSGALFGDTPQQAFYVKCDVETNPPESRDLGRVIVEIGVAVVKPAEFVIFRIGQKAAQ